MVRHITSCAKAVFKLSYKAPTVDNQAELLRHSIPIWPTQLRQYTETTLPLESLSRDYNVQAMQIDLAWCETQGDWEEFTHPSGATYHYNEKMKMYAETNLRTCLNEELQRLEAWIDASRAKIHDNQWLLVIEPMVARGIEIYPYYYMVPENHVITWIEPVNGYLLFQECMMDLNLKPNIGNT
ncbi:hypothetical protein BDR06DRAFT_1007127 [Suillus hirtellus]|nr:hypothetical protein BDR06DRAFT_1007127 [Suillus hirtellus]